MLKLARLIHLAATYQFICSVLLSYWWRKPANEQLGSFFERLALAVRMSQNGSFRNSNVKTFQENKHGAFKGNNAAVNC